MELLNTICVLLVLSFPVFYWCFRARVELSLFSGLLMGITHKKIVACKDGIAYDVHTVQYLILFASVSFIWTKEIGTYDE